MYLVGTSFICASNAAHSSAVTKESLLEGGGKYSNVLHKISN